MERAGNKCNSTPFQTGEGDAGNQTRGILEKSLVAKYLGFYFRFLHINKIACKSHYIVFLAQISIFKYTSKHGKTTK